MNLSRILYPVNVLGPGNRVGIWLCGCDRTCKGCSNPELWQPRPEYEVSVEKVYGLIQQVSAGHMIDGFTISGGEPMLQAAELVSLIRLLKGISTDILVYSGFQIEELRESKDQAIGEVLSNIAVLIDGAYVEEKNDGSVLRGSSNQRVHLLSERHRDLYAQYMSKAHNQIQNFTTTNGIVSVGIHHRGFTR